MPEYTININAPQTQRFYNWQKDNNNEWFIEKEYCGNCHVNLNWKWGPMHFCPRCGFMINGTNNSEPPKEVK